MLLFFKNLKPVNRRLILLCLDLILIYISLLFSSFPDFNTTISNASYTIIIILASLIYLTFGQYKGITIYRGSYFFYGLLIRNLLLLISLIFLLPIKFSSVQQTLNFFLILILSQSLLRFILKDILLRIYFKEHKQKKNVVIYGAGEAGAQLSASIKISNKYKLLSFIDDDPHKYDRTLWGFTIRPRSYLKQNSKNIDIVLIAIPSLNISQRKNILKDIANPDFAVMQIPSLEDLADSNIKIDNIKPITIDDILGRESVVPDPSLLALRIKGNTVFVTGAGGSIGQELCKQIILLKPKKLILLDNCEFNLYTINNILMKILPEKTELIPILGNSSNNILLDHLINKHNIKIILHAAAYKHVPLVEDNPIEGILNNVFTTKAICQASIQSNVEHVILISTDKAVRPTNFMGASKRLAELVVKSYNEENKLSAKKEQQNRTNLSIVRFGNVLGSSGSVVPLFREQIANGGPVTITHQDVSRYFMTIEEASQLVLQALGLAKGGEIFLLDMGTPVLIRELAEQMIKLSGLTISNSTDKTNQKDSIAIEYTGLRKGEKLNEELLISGYSTPTSHPLIFCAEENFIPYKELNPKLDKLKKYAENFNIQEVSTLLKELVPEWTEKKL